ncbi:MAG: metal-sulfur cluster assembly factor [Thermoprotei archaeon]|nr:iron-sulfur cluster assembly protein [TACK group archaeon]
MDPEVQVGIVEMNLVDEVDISSDNEVKVRFHLTTPFCPAQFAYAIALQIKDKVSALPGVKKVVVEVKDHFLAKEINDAVNGDVYDGEGTQTS